MVVGFEVVVDATELLIVVVVTVVVATVGLVEDCVVVTNNMYINLLSINLTRNEYFYSIKEQYSFCFIDTLKISILPFSFHCRFI